VLHLYTDGQVHPLILCSRRSATLRTYAGDTSLPGGKVDLEDRTWEDTAVRDFSLLRTFKLIMAIASSGARHLKRYI
jgi:hypothetical protein